MDAAQSDTTVGTRRMAACHVLAGLINPDWVVKSHERVQPGRVFGHFVPPHASSIQHDMSTHSTAHPYQKYPAYCFHASPTYDTWVKLTAADVQALEPDPDFQGSQPSISSRRI